MLVVCVMNWLCRGFCCCFCGGIAVGEITGVDPLCILAAQNPETLGQSSKFVFVNCLSLLLGPTQIIAGTHGPGLPMIWCCCVKLQACMWLQALYEDIRLTAVIAIFLLSQITNWHYWQSGTSHNCSRRTAYTVQLAVHFMLESLNLDYSEYS